MTTFKNGYSGGTGGEEYTDESVESTSSVTQVRIGAGTLIDSIQMVHKLKNGTTHEFPKHGGSGGDPHVVTLNDNEYITKISGKYGSRVDSITIHTNTQDIGPFGGDGGSADYIYEAPDGYEIIGFHCRAGNRVDAIGVVYRKR